MGEPADVVRIHAVYKAQLYAQMHVETNNGKVVLYTRTDDDLGKGIAAAHEIGESVGTHFSTTTHGLKICGTPFGEDTFIREKLRDYAVKFKREADAIKPLITRNLQSGLLVTRLSTSSKLLHFARTVRPDLVCDALSDVSQEVLSDALRLMWQRDDDVDDDLLTATSFPARKAGLGLTRVNDIADAAFVAAALETRLSALSVCNDLGERL